MSKLHIRNALVVIALTFPVVALADVAGTPTLNSGSTLSLDTGTVATSGGDILFAGGSVTTQGSATAADVADTPIADLYVGSSGYQTLVSQGSTLITTYAGLLASYLVSGTITPKVNDILVVKTNGGNYSAVLVTAISSTSISLEFHTFEAASTSTGPTVTALANNYSNLSSGLPNYGIAPGSLFLIYGTDLTSAATVPSNPFPLATTLNNTKVSVTVNGTTVEPGLYYVYPTQIAAVLPSTTPVGTGTITVTNGSQTSSTFSIQVVQSAFGIDTLYGTGTGEAVVTDANYKVIGYSASASPGQTVIIWGSGVGADPKNNDLTYPAPNLDNLTSIPMQAYIGGISANILYRGRSQYPGVDQVVVTIPANVTPGCNVSIALLSGSGSVASNVTTIAVNAGGGACSDPNSPYNITSLSGDSTVSFGFVEVLQSVSLLNETALARPSTPVTSTRIRTTRPFTAPRGPRATPTTSNTAFGVFDSIQGTELGNYASYDTASVGSCVVFQESLSTTTPTTPFKETGLDAGDITVTGPNGSAPLPPLAEESGFYDASLSSSFIPSTGGSFTFSGGGGKNVGPFNTTVTLGSPLFSWTNMATTTSVTRSSGLNITWQGGEPGTWVEISGYSSGSTVGAGFYCLANQSALQFTVPSWVTESLPAGQGGVDVTNASTLVKFTATGLNFAYAYAGVDDSTEIPYN